MALYLHEIGELRELHGAAQGDQVAWDAERMRLVRLCARLTHNPEAAEDLAQEALLEAWRSREALRDAERFSAWLAGIARNVCLRWLHRQGAPLARAVSLADEETAALDEWLADPETLEIELERRELAALLDRAMALLPAETREALLAHYLEEAPLAEIAERLGVRASAVAVRLQRGRLALRHVLTTELRGELAAYRLTDGEEDWRETRLWCPSCGERRLMGRYNVGESELWLRCPACDTAPGSFTIHTHAREILGGVRGFTRARDRVVAWMDRYYTPHLRAGSVPCQRCGRPLALRYELSASVGTASPGNARGLSHWCPSCERDCWASLDGLALASPEGVAFARRNPRLRTLPQVEIETAGRAAVVARFESVAGAERLAVIVDATTFELLRTERGGL